MFSTGDLSSVDSLFSVAPLTSEFQAQLSSVQVRIVINLFIGTHSPLVVGVTVLSGSTLTHSQYTNNFDGNKIVNPLSHAFSISIMAYMMVFQKPFMLSTSSYLKVNLFSYVHFSLSPVTNKHHFVDGPLLYQFRMNFRRRRRLIELLHEHGRSIPESHDSPFCLRKQNSDGGNTSFLSGGNCWHTHTRTHSVYHSGHIQFNVT